MYLSNCQGTPTTYFVLRKECEAAKIYMFWCISNLVNIFVNIINRNVNKVLYIKVVNKFN